MGLGTFRETPAPELRQILAQLGFHWNRERQAWQHPCGAFRLRGFQDPHEKYASYFPADTESRLIQTSRAGIPPPLLNLHTMKRNKRRLPIPQHEFGFTPAHVQFVCRGFAGRRAHYPRAGRGSGETPRGGSSAGRVFHNQGNLP